MSDQQSVIRILEHAPVKAFRCELDQRDYPADDVNKAYQLYVMDDQTPTEIAAALKIPVAVVEYFCLRNRWAERKRELVMQSLIASEMRERKFQAQEREWTIKKHVVESRKAIEKASKMIDTVATPDALKKTVEAMAAAATMEARAVSLAERVQQTKDPTADQQQNAPPGSMVWVGIGLAPDAKPPTPIDVPSKEIPPDAGKS